MIDIVDKYCLLYENWKQTHYSQSIYDELVNLYDTMTPEQKAKASQKLTIKHDN